MTIISKPKEAFRSYKEEIEDLSTDSVAHFYYQNHTMQTFEYATEQNRILRQRLFERQGEQLEMTIWEAMDKLDHLVDESDPDTSNAQTQHAFQTAESARKKFPHEKVLHLICLIHDMGKVLCFHPRQTLQQWSVVGDTFILGMPFNQNIVHHKFFAHNPDNTDPKFNSNELGVYKEGCGFDNCVFSFGHDEYLYQVLKANNCQIPERWLRVIRYHSFYPWHRARNLSYERIANTEDKTVLLQDVLKFNQFDLYSKSDDIVDIPSVKPYYEQLAREFQLDGKLRW
jgi:inositol oxygenase